MRRSLVVLLALLIVLPVFTACSGKNTVKVEDPVTMEQVNTEARYVARAFIESVFSNDRDMFYACYPDKFIDDLGKASGLDFFEQYSQTATLNGVLVGTASSGTTDYTVENGYDAAAMKSRISFATGVEYTKIEQISIQKLIAVFKNSSEREEAEFSLVVFKSEGSWYMFEMYKGESA